MDERIWLDRCHQYSFVDGESGFQVNFAGMNFNTADMDRMAARFPAVHAEMQKIELGEIKNPVRSLTSIVRVTNREDTMVSVKSAAPVPKGKMFEIMERIHNTGVEAPVKIGDVILADVFGTEIVATKEIL